MAVKAQFLAATCIVSLIVLAVLAGGYFGHVGFVKARSAGLSGSAGQAAKEATFMLAEDGRVLYWREHGPNGAAARQILASFGRCFNFFPCGRRIFVVVCGSSMPTG